MRVPALPDDGHERYTIKRVVFSRPFTLGNGPEVYAAGPYEVETKEHALDAGGHAAHVRVATVLIIPTPTGICCREVRGSELDEALTKDAEYQPPLDPSENPDRGDAAPPAVTRR